LLVPDVIAATVLLIDAAWPGLRGVSRAGQAEDFMSAEAATGG